MVGDFVGYDFFDVYGCIVNIVMNDCVIGLGIDEFCLIVEVIVIVVENSKLFVFLGVLCTGVIDVIVISVSNVLIVFNLDE